MKKRFMSFIAAISLLAFVPTNAFTSGYPVFDVSGWLAAIDQLYQAYDMVNNTITQIENQYKSIQQSIEAAKSIDWDNIQFDGDFDIRNDIKDATKRVNRLLTQARNIKQTITTPSINCGNVKYSIADLCGATSSDMWESRKNLFTAVSDYKYYMTSTMKSAVDDVVKGLTPEQRKAIWTKYGISPANYVFVQQSQTAVMSAASQIMAKANEQAKQLEAEDKIARGNAIIGAAYKNMDSNGNPSAAGMQEAQMHLTQLVQEQLLDLGFTMSEIGELVAAKMIKEDAEKQAEIDEASQKQETQLNANKRTSSSFKKKE